MDFKVRAGGEKGDAGGLAGTDDGTCCDDDVYDDDDY